MSRLLVIDDDDELRAVLVEMLEAEGYQVDSAADGTTGVARARESPPDLILSDIMMGGLDGYGVLAAVREDPRSALVPIVFLTGVGGPLALRKGMELGADDYLVKPIRREDLVRAVEARLARHAEVRQNLQRRLDGLRSTLAQSMPHEFLTPLTAVIGLSSLLIDDASLDQVTVREAMQGIFVGGQRLQEMIATFLLYAELEGARLEPNEPQRPDLDALHAGALIEEAARGKATQTGRTADLELDVADLSLRMRRDHLRPLVEELAENAFAFSRPGTSVKVVLRAAGARCVLSVSDQGQGMSTEQIKGLEHYAPFRRHQEQPGLGLGLAIVRRVAQLYGGELTFETALGQGTTARVELPLAS